jgi:chromosome segregation ATPase
MVKIHFHHHSLDKEREGLKNEITRTKKQIASSEQIIRNQDAEMIKLTRIIDEAERERERQEKEIKNSIIEKNLLCTQVTHRNEEVAKAYHQMRVYRGNLMASERQYKDLQSRLFTKQEELGEIKRRADENKASVSCLPNLRKTIIQLEKELRTEQRKVKSLSEELSRPINVHRWRKLESSDPHKFELIQSIQQLQKLFIEKSDDIMQKDLEIKEQEQLYDEIQAILER